MYQALYRKYRPERFEDVVGQEHVTSTLRSQVAGGHLGHAYLFVGTRGTGKTTCARILARAANCEHPINGSPCNECPSCRSILDGSVLDVEEIDAASNSGVDNIRSLRDEAVYTPSALKKRVYIIDEVHMLSTGAFNALLKILEEPPEHILFVLATTELQKVLPTILSRCQRFTFRRLTPAEIEENLLRVAQKERLRLEKPAAALLSRLADGSMRDGLSLLDQCVGKTTIDEAAVRAVVGLAGADATESLVRDIFEENVSGALRKLGDLYADGKSLESILGELSGLMRDLLVCRVADPETVAALLSGSYDPAVLRSLSSAVPAERLSWLLKELQSAAAALRTAAEKRTVTELCLIRLCRPELCDDPAALLSRLAALEAGSIERIVPAVPTKVSGQPDADVKPDAPAPAAPAAEPEPLPPAKPREFPAAEPLPPAKAPAPDPVPIKAPAVPGANADVLWSKTLKAVGSDVPIFISVILGDSAHLQPYLRGQRLLLHTKTPLAGAQLQDGAFLQKLQAAAGGILGVPVKVEIVSSAPGPEEAPPVQTAPAVSEPDEGPEPPPEEAEAKRLREADEKLDALGEFPNVIFKDVPRSSL